MVPQPVTTPSPGMMVSSMPKSTARWVTNMSYSSKAAGIEQHVEALAGGELALAVLGVDALLPATKASVGALLIERGDDGVHCVPCPAVSRRPYTREQRAWRQDDADMLILQSCKL